ncbi:MAG: Gliding motility-associated C-terminal protein, partial [Mucilaginibacter sp.]|nr:Gliding motility-associated C-terminal protein [Mucilaginibacter sp.]
MKAFWLIYLSLLIACIANIAVVDAQAPVIVPKPGTIILHLDATGNYKVQLSDVATINGSYNSVSVTPANFNCSNVGSQTVIVYAANTTGNDPTVRLNYPYGIVCDASGNIYVADAGNNQIKKITPGGIVSVFAGTGAVGSANGAGSIASFNRPWGITMDTKGNIYVADAGNNKIRKITSSGFVSTIAGSGAKGSKNDTGVFATFNNPAGVAVDAAGNLYIVDSDNNLIREITTDGSVSTFAGNGLYSSIDGTGINAGFYDPHGIAIDQAGFLYIADGNNRIRKISPTGMVITFAGNNSGHNDGIGTAASFYFPIGITIDAAGNLYIADTGNNLIRRVTAGGVVNTIVGNGSIGTIDGVGTNAVLNAPIGIALDPSGNLYVTDGPDNKIRKIAPDLKVTTLSLIGSNGSNTLSASLPVTVTVASQPVITSAYDNVTVAAYQNCSPMLPDYTLSATASDNCHANAVTFTQLPVAGTPLTIGVPVNVSLTATDASGSTAKVTFAVNVVNSTDKLVNFNSNPIIFAGNGIKLQPAVNGDIANYSWLPADGLSNPTIKNPVAKPSVTTTYTLTVTTTGGCTASADVTVTVLDQVMIPNAFTPNGDGINDFWNIAHLNEYPGCIVDI